MGDKLLRRQFRVFLVCLFLCSCCVTAGGKEKLEKYTKLTMAVSGGRNSSNRVFIQVGNHVFFDNIPHSRETAGLYVVGILDNEVLLQSQYSMFANGRASMKLARDIEKLPKGTFVVVAAKDEPTRNFNQMSQDTLYQIGAEEGLLNREPRSSYLCLGIKGMSRGDAIEQVGMQELTYAGPEVGKAIKFVFPSKPEKIDFSDSNLERCIHEALHIPVSAGITTKDMLRLTSLSARAMNIATLTGIEYAHNLQVINLRDNMIADVSPLSKLIKLTDLNLHGNRISDISPLSSLTNLTTLTVYRNHRIADISPLSGLTNLVALSVGYNKITDISSISTLTKLESLGIRDNEITDISPVSQLTKLKDITLWHNQVRDISPLSNLKSLEKLNFGENQAPDISPLSNLKNLKELDASENQVVDISAVSGLTNLTLLDLRTNKISTISDISNLANLKTLNIEHNNIRNILPLRGLTNLEWLHIRDNQIADISPLAKLTKLSTLSCRDNQISDISSIRNLTNLTKLYLQHNQIHDISPLAKMTKLKTLELWGNKIETILPLLKLKEIEILDIGRNHIHRISGIFRLTKLTRLNLRENQISDIRAIKALENLLFLDISENPIDRHGYQTDITMILRSNPGCKLLSDRINTQTLQNSFSSYRDISSKKVVLIIASSNFRDEELFETKATIEKANVQPVIASTKKGTIKGMLGGTATAELLIEDVVVDDYDVVVFVGGSGAREFFDNQIALDIARQAVKKKKLLAAICIAPTVLANAGVLNGVKATSAPSQKINLKKTNANYTGVAVEQDGLIITGDGPKSSSQFSKAIVNAMLLMH